MSTVATKQYKKDVVNRLGGSFQYQKFIIEFTERLARDSKLQPFYGRFSFDSIHKVQTELLELAFCQMESEAREKLYAKLAVYHSGLFMLGMNSANFNDIKNHLLGALLNSWADSDVIDDIGGLFEELRKELFDTGITSTSIVPEF